MNNSEIVNFIRLNSNETIKEYNDRLLTKLEDISKMINWISISIILLVTLYYFLSSSIITQVELGVLKFNKIDVVSIIIPPLFILSMLWYLIVSAHKAELEHFSKVLCNFLFSVPNITTNDFLPGEFNFYSRIYLPFSHWRELEKTTREKWSILNGLFILPLTLVVFLPFYFAGDMILDLYELKNLSLIGNISFYTTSYLIAYTLFYFFRNMKINLSKKAENEFIANQVIEEIRLNELKK